ncbi:hypothetical protein AaE_012948 [Aphanomyces astaci]|uniref:DDE Tnp4 domain-containing protein n=1 Tax=Aphanomyces astaci TaxID=112090 RepID=A0A6A4Z9K8_APHAT|nr:hypothetical protein AaE_012948 [Aphanomyces astaci]
MVLTQIELHQLLPLARTSQQHRRILLLCALAYVERPLVPDIRFNLNRVPDANARLDFRFDVAGIKSLGYLLGLPAVVITTQRYRVNRDEAMCIVLGRLVFQTRLHTMSRTFGRSRPALCAIFNHVIREIFDCWKSFIYFNDRLVQRNIGAYCDAVYSKGAPLGNVFGFIDGTKVQSCRISSTGGGQNFHILSGFKGNDISSRKRDFNKWMSRVRQSVEWNFMIMKSLWAFITFKNLSKIRLSPVAKIVCVAMLLTNCHCCYYGGNQISDYFGLEPPSLEEYLDTVEVVVV